MQKLKDEIRNKIIEAAIKEFSTLGYEKASMRTIAKAAGISVSNTYNYYPSKEKLFESIIEPVFVQLRSILKQSFQQAMGKGLGGNYVQPFVDSIVSSMVQMDARQRQLLIIIAEKSAGTKYEKAREDIVSLLKMHLAEAARKPGGASQIDEGQGYILSIIAANFIDGLFKVLKDYRSKEWVEENIRTLLTYHLNGIKALAG